ncbi:MAG: PAS domain-containing protein [Mycobacteriales bacterium]
MSNPGDRDPFDGGPAEAAGSPLTEFVVARDGRLLTATPLASDLLGVRPDAGGTPFSELVSPDSASALLALVDRACSADAHVIFEGQRWVPLDGDARRLSGGIVPMKNDIGSVVGASVTVNAAIGVEAGLQNHNDALLRDNDELRSIADELRQRTDELNVVAVFLQSVLTSLRGAVVVIDRTWAVRVWNAQAELIWGIPRRTAMRSLLGELDLGFPHSELTGRIDAGLRGEVSDDAAVTVARPNQAPAGFTLSVTPLLGPGATVHGVTLLFLERSHRLTLPD